MSHKYNFANKKEPIKTSKSSPKLPRDICHIIILLNFPFEIFAKNQISTVTL